MTTRKGVIAAVFMSVAVVAVAWGAETVTTYQPQACGGPLKLGFVQKIVYIAQNGSTPVGCVPDPSGSGACASPGTSCVDGVTGVHGKCTNVPQGTAGVTCVCQKDSNLKKNK
jgi:hypothetical protein